MRGGEAVFVALIGLVGAAWIMMSTRLHYMDGPVPSGGYLPFWIGVVLVVLVGIHALSSRRARQVGSDDAEPLQLRKLLLIIGGLFACIALVEPIGFGAAIALYIAFLLGYVERAGWRAVAGISALTPACLVVVFRTLLSVPLPRGPWGF